MLLRIAIGYHFFKEGTTKLKSGNFSAKPFLASAKGPLAPMFQRMLDDPDGSQQLCIKKTEMDDGRLLYEIDPTLTIAIWMDFIDQATSIYGLGSASLQEDIAQRRDVLAQTINAARSDKDTAIDTAELEAERAAGERDILRIREQRSRAQTIVDEHIDMLDDWIVANRIEVIAHFGTVGRLEGFERDGQNRSESATRVESTRGQIDTIRGDRQKQLKVWTDEMSAIWDSLERKINGLAVDRQTNNAEAHLHRPFDQPGSFYKTINRVIPWFDTIVGGLLILGLFTRFASLAAASFLVSVILTQPPWIPGAAPTYFHFIESLALLVIFATCAGRLGGLDYFISLRKTWPRRPEIEGQS